MTSHPLARSLAFAALAALTACARPAPSPAPAPPPRAAPSSPAGELDRAIAPKSMVVLGDMHGTREIPRFVGELTRAAVRRAPVTLALEMPPGATQAIDAYLASDGSAAARARVLGDAWWREDYQDGRRSVAMLDLIETVRALRQGGAAVELLRFGVTFLVYVGNLHAARREVSWKKGFRWMAGRMADAGLAFTSLAPRYTEGTAWICRDAEAAHCGVSFVGSPHASAAGLRLEPSADGNYDGWFGVGPIGASPPAAKPELAADLGRAIAAAGASPAAWRARARAAYDANDFRGCADWYGRVAEPTADDAYDAACCLARAGERDAAVERLRFALDHGLRDVEQLERDEDLASLRDHPRWPSRPK
ncbi:MAG: hypothetical protein MUF34_33445 [Polyangiaceae bacterium]|nr:hypothetical protein [Polyangiaceae bacterium]